MTKRRLQAAGSLFEVHACLPTKAGKVASHAKKTHAIPIAIGSKGAKKEKTPVQMAKGRAGKEEELSRKWSKACLSAGRRHPDSIVGRRPSEWLVQRTSWERPAGQGTKKKIYSAACGYQTETLRSRSGLMTTCRMRSP
jgi:hypothetical protein